MSGLERWHWKWKGKVALLCLALFQIACLSIVRGEQDRALASFEQRTAEATDAGSQLMVFGLGVIGLAGAGLWMAPVWFFGSIILLALVLIYRPRRVAA